MTDETPALRRSNAHVIRQEKNGATKVIRTRQGKRWNNRDEAIFLEELAASCNVRGAAAKVGFSTTAVYNRRLKNPGFAAEWHEAVQQGYARLEAMLLEEATDSLRSEPISGAAPSPQVSFSERLNLLRLHRAEVRGGAPQDYRAREKAPEWDEISESILRKMDAFDRAEARKAKTSA